MGYTTVDAYKALNRHLEVMNLLLICFSTALSTIKQPKQRKITLLRPSVTDVLLGDASSLYSLSITRPTLKKQVIDQTALKGNRTKFILTC